MPVKRTLAAFSWIGLVALLAACASAQPAPAGGEPTATAAAASTPQPTAVGDSQGTPGAGTIAAKVDRLAGAYIATHKEAGVVVGVIKDGERWVKGYGGSNGAGTPAPDGATIYEIGSITKVFTGMVLAAQVEQSQAKLDDPLADYLPAGTAIAPGAGGITLRHLATHTSGLPRLPDNLMATIKDQANTSVNPYANYTIDDLFASLATVKLAGQPGAVSEYSNYGAALLGQALANKRGQPYEDLVRDTVIAPLGLADTTFAVSDAQKARLTPGHTPDGAVASGWDFQGVAPAGALKSTANDLLAFLDANISGNHSIVNRSHESLYKSDAGEVGYLWQIAPTPDGRTIIWHNGGTGGYVSFIGFDIKEGVGVVVLSNYGDAAVGDSSIDQLGFDLLGDAPSLPLR